MKNTLLRTALCLAAASVLLGCHKHAAETTQPLDGVWEGPMSVSETGVTTVKVLNVKDNTTAEFYDMKYSLAGGYEVLSKESTSIERLSGGARGFRATVGGEQLTFDRDGDCIMHLGDDEESSYFYHLTDNDISYYKPASLTESLLPNDKEFLGPSKLQLSLPSEQQFTAEDFDWIEFLEWAGKTAATTAWGKGVGVLLDMLFPASGEATTLDDLLGKMDEISNQLTQMTILYKNTTYEKYLNDRSKMVSELTNCNSEYFTRLSNISSDDEEETEAKVKEIILAWSKNTVGGNPVTKQWLNYVDFLLKTVIEQKDIFNMYDLYTYNTTAWESQGYAIREALRASDIATVAQTLYLTQLYNKVRDDIDDKSREQFLTENIDRFEEFSEYIKNRPVERHDDRGICQIEGAHFVMDSYPLDYPNYSNPSWNSIPCPWSRYNSDVFFMWGPNQAENYSKALKPDEVKRILDYYEGSDRTLGEIFKEDANIKLGAWIVTQSYNGVLPLQSGYYSPDWDYVGVDAAVFLKTAKSSSDIKPTACGYASLGASGWQMKLTFLKWYEYYSDYIWTRTNVIER